MTPDLKFYADHNTRIPGKVLNPAPSDHQSWKLLASHWIDFSCVTTAAVLMAAMYNQSMDLLIPTASLRRAFSQDEIQFLSVLMIPMMLWVNFFFSYFMNHGQSYGMTFLKKRWKMKEKSFRDSAWLAVHSTALCLSGGVTFYFQKHVFDQFVSHDYLYTNLVALKEEKGPDLFQIIEDFEAVPEEIPFEEAA